MSSVSVTPANSSSAVAQAGLSARLAEHALGFDATRLPETTLRAAKRAALDGIGVMLAASGESPEIRAFLDIARAHGGAPRATILGFGERVGAADAALVNGAMAHALDYEDAFDPAPLHPNASLLPAALASAEALEGAQCSGPQFLTALALGCDLVCRLGLSLRRPLEAGGWYPPPILGAFGATLAAARIQGLSARQLCDAWSMLLCQNSCPGEIKYSADTVLRAVREAFPAQAALQCVQLAARGVRGFDAPLEGQAAFYALFAGGSYDATALTAQLGERFWIEQLSFKRWPSCRGTHAYIEAARVLKLREPFEPADIGAIVCAGGDLQRMLAEPLEQKRAPRTLIDAKFSIPFTVALALLQADITLGSFTADALRDPQVLALAAKCQFRHAPADDARAAAGELTLQLRDGRTLQHRVSHSLGDPTRPLSDSALIEKFIDCAARAAQPLPPERARRYALRVLSLEHEPQAARALLDLR